THSDLATPFSGARQKKIREVDTGQQQHKPDNRHQQPGESEQRPAHPVAEQTGSRKGYPAAFIVVRIFAFKLQRKLSQLSLRLRRADARLESPLHKEILYTSRIQPIPSGLELRLQCNRKPHLSNGDDFSAVKAARSYANDCKAAAVHDDVASDHTRI